MENFNLEEYLSSGVEKIITAIFQTSLKNPKESLFMSKYIITSKKARKRRQINEENGKHIPPFLIASITTSCNLHCKGCYARANHSCHDDKHDIQGMLSSDKWGEIFTEAEELGIGFISLRDTLQSPLFVKLRENGTLEKEVKSILGNKEL